MWLVLLQAVVNVPWFDWRNAVTQLDQTSYIAELLYQDAGLTVEDAAQVPGGVRQGGVLRTSTQPTSYVILYLLVILLILSLRLLLLLLLLLISFLLVLLLHASVFASTLKVSIKVMFRSWFECLFSMALL
jgi:hypothetical protein